MSFLEKQMRINNFLTTGILAATLMLAACGNSTVPTIAVKSTQALSTSTTRAAAGAVAVGTQAPTSAATPTTVTAQEAAPAAGGEAAGGEAAGGEAALVAYANTQQGFSIERPAPWTQDMTVIDGVKFVGGDGSLTLAFIKNTSADVLAFATNDTKTFAATLPSYKLVGLAPSTEVNNAVVLGFETTSTSQVTGKTYAARGDRYYIGLKDGRIAVLTMISSAKNYDREGVRDIALTLKVTK
jgi:hypothetical protein